MELILRVCFVLACLFSLVECNNRLSKTNCKPRKTMVPISIDGLNYIPHFVWLKRCSGMDDIYSVYKYKCVADKTKSVGVQVISDQSDFEMKFFEEHLSCKMERCSAEILNCPKGTVYNDMFCRCEIEVKRRSCVLEKKDSSDFVIPKKLLVVIVLLIVSGCLMLIISVLVYKWYRLRHVRRSILTSDYLACKKYVLLLDADGYEILYRREFDSGRELNQTRELNDRAEFDNHKCSSKTRVSFEDSPTVMITSVV